jgi:hypothetical protein
MGRVERDDPQLETPSYIMDRRMMDNLKYDPRKMLPEDGTALGKVDRYLGPDVRVPPRRTKKSLSDRVRKRDGLTKEQRKTAVQLQSYLKTDKQGPKYSESQIAQMAQAITPNSDGSRSIMLSDNPRVREVVESFGGKAQSSTELFKEMVDKGQMTEQEAGKLTTDSDRRSDKKIKRMAGFHGAKEVGKAIGRGIGNEVAGWFESASPELFSMFRDIKHNYKAMKATYKYGKEKRITKIAAKEGRAPTDKATLRAEKLRSQLSDQQRGTSSTARQSPNQSLAKRMKNRQTPTPQPTVKKPERSVRRSTVSSPEL